MKSSWVVFLCLSLCCAAVSDVREAALPRLDAAVVSLGSDGRLPAFLARADSGEALTVGVVGGSITAGASATEPSKRWANRFVDRLRAAYPKSTFPLVNAGIGATGSDLATHRATRDLLGHAPDLVVIEFAVNDSINPLAAETFEGLLRQILNQPQAPAAMCLFTMNEKGQNVQAEHEPVGRHYGIPMVSMRDALWPEIEAGRLAWTDYGADEVHPNDRGHAYCAELLWALAEGQRGLPAERGPLPTPLLNNVFEHTALHLPGGTKPTRNEGWQVVNEGPFGKAWQADSAGAFFEFPFSGSAVSLAYYRLKGDMGRAEVRVDYGPPVPLEGWFNADWGGYTACQLIARGLAPGQHQLRVTVLDGAHPQSQGNTFRIDAVLEAGTQRTAPLMRGTLWWIVPSEADPWTRAKLEAAIDAQRALGFDVLWILNTPDLLRRATLPDASQDILADVYALADEKEMHVIADLPTGGWYGKVSAEEMTASITTHARKLHARYGHHPSFYGWYLNHEINPMVPGEEEEPAFWRAVWKDTTAICHELAPGSKVTISPFFLLDDGSHRGFIYLSPEQQGAFWEASLRESGIDILMLQDSGEHLSFFTLEEREPFFAAIAAACHRAGAQFWVNVETGEAHASDWQDYLTRTAQKDVPWRFTPMPWLEEKLALAARYGDSIINWGYFPYMDPSQDEAARAAHAVYKHYYEAKHAQGEGLPALP